MNLNLNDDQMVFLLTVLGQHHAVLWMQGKDCKEVEDILRYIADEMTKNGKIYNFEKVFQTHDH